MLPRGSGPNQEGPIFVPKGTFIWMSAPASCGPESVWNDPGVFRPARWALTLEERSHRQLGLRSSPVSMENSRGNINNILFSYGKRACPGQSFALLVAKYFIVRLYQQLSKVSLVPTGSNEEEMGWGGTIRNALWLRLRFSNDYNSFGGYLHDPPSVSFVNPHRSRRTTPTTWRRRNTWTTSRP